MRLIDVDELIKVLKQRATNENIMGYMTAYDVTNSIIDEVEEQPTAYNINKVVEELEELDVKAITRYKNGNFGNFDGVEYYIKKRKAIEIVKQCGVGFDDACEWKLTDTKKLMPYKTSCGNEDLYDNSYKYCPYCSKKIKLV